MIEQTGNLRSRNVVGSGMIRLVWKVCPSNGGELKSGNVSPFVGSVSGGAFPRLVLPGLEVLRLGGPDAEQDPQDLGVAHPLRQRRIQAGAALLDEREVE